VNLSRDGLLVLDVGNTSVQGLYLTKKGRKRFRFMTAEATKKTVSKIKSLVGARAPEVLVASVVPEAGAFLRKELPKKLRLKTFQIPRDLAVPIRNRYRNPSQVGVDRLLGALAAFRRYRKALIVIDFGTAITFDFVNSSGEYRGGAIAPGIEIALEALFQKTALLPRIRLKSPRGVIGRDTTESIRAGCAYGIGGLCDRLVETIARRQGVKPFVVATGGYARFMSKYCRRIDRIHPDLVLEGILLTYFDRRAV